MKKILWLIAIVALITVGCSNKNKEVAEEQVIDSGETEVAAELVVQPEEVGEKEELKTYISQENDFSFEYPSNFEVTEDNYQADFDNTHVMLVDSDNSNYTFSLDVNHPGTGFEMVEDYKEDELITVNGESITINFWQNTEDSLSKSMMAMWDYNEDKYLVYMRFRADSETAEFENTFKEIILSIE